VTIARSSASPPAGAVSGLFQFGPEGTTFAGPVAVSFPIPAGTLASDVAVYWTRPGSRTEWETLPASVSGTTATAGIAHFSAGYVGLRPQACSLLAGTWTVTAHCDPAYLGRSAVVAQSGCTATTQDPVTAAAVAVDLSGSSVTGPPSCSGSVTGDTWSWRCGSCDETLVRQPLCFAGLACTPSGPVDPCKVYATTCSAGGVQACSSAADKPDGAACSGGRTCSAGSCGAPGLFKAAPAGFRRHWASIAAQSSIYRVGYGLQADGSLWTLGYVNAVGGWVLPGRMSADTDWAQVVTEQHTVAIKADGTLWTWGAASWGLLLGDGTTTDRYAPAQVGSDRDWASAAVDGRSAAYTMAIKTDGTLWGWGMNDMGQLGDGTRTDRPLPVQIGLDSDWKQVSAGFLTLAVKTDGSLWAWGDAWNTGLAPLVPTRVGGENQWTFVESGSSAAFAVKADGSLWGTGYGGQEALGTGNSEAQLGWVPVGAPNRFRAVSSRWNSTVAIKTDGTLWAWGRNSDGQLGAPTVTPCWPQGGRPTTVCVPTQVGTIDRWTAVSTNGYLTQALTADGNLWSSGRRP
jgi:alpha-tubulin suppressor-like RCC1 family protein